MYTQQQMVGGNPQTKAAAAAVFVHHDLETSRSNQIPLRPIDSIYCHYSRMFQSNETRFPNSKIAIARARTLQAERPSLLLSMVGARSI